MLGEAWLGEFQSETDRGCALLAAAFLDEQLKVYMDENGLPYVALINPDDFVRWIFPRLFQARIPRYEAIAKQYGYTISTNDLAKVKSEADFVNLVADAIARKKINN